MLGGCGGWDGMLEGVFAVVGGWWSCVGNGVMGKKQCFKLGNG